MNEILGTKILELPLEDLKWQRDLIYFEGPLLSEYLSSRNETYLKYWCDCDSNYNRWMYFKIKEQDRLRLVLGEKSLYDAIVNQPDSFVFIADEGEIQEQRRYSMAKISELPDSYLPCEEDSCLDIADYKGELKITSLIFEDSWEFEDLKDLYKKFTQVYDFIYISNRYVANFGQTMPWQGGFNYTYFYKKIKEFILPKDYSKLNSIHYASPGYIKIESEPEISRLALIAINHYAKNKQDNDRVYLELQNRIKELQLNQIEPTSAVSYFEEDSECIALYKQLAAALQGVEIDWLNKFVESDFERCKILMGHFRRIRTFNNYLKDGNVRVVDSIMS